MNFKYEIVIGEDCSTDSARAVVMAFYRRYPDRIRLLLRDQNVGANRNSVETIEACHGEYMAILEGDDYWIATDKLQKQVDFLDTNPECAIYCGRARDSMKATLPDCDAKLDVYPALPAGRYTFAKLTC